MIPKTLQLHWLWDNPPPFMDTVVDRWTVMLPGWDIMVIRDVPFDFPSEFRPYLTESRIPPANRADLFRNWSLWRYGGIYVDMDTLPVRVPDDWLLDRECFIPLCRMGAGDSRAHPFTDSCFIGSVKGHPFWPHVWENCRHPEAWVSPTQWFCGVNTFHGSEQYGVDSLDGLCREVTHGECEEFIDRRGDVDVPLGPEYMVHFRSSMAMERRKIMHSHWTDGHTWRDVYEHYPYEADKSIVPRNTEKRSRINWGERK